MAFALFFLGEYANMILMSSQLVVFFLGGWLSVYPFSGNIFIDSFFFSVKVVGVAFFFLIARAVLP